MIKHFIIDGNNLMGKMSSVERIRSITREQLVFRLDRYFDRKKQSVSLHFDGFQKETIPSSKIKISYSQKKEADYEIKKEIENLVSANAVCVVTSDFNLMEFAKVCRCKVEKSEDFLLRLKGKNDNENEEEKIRSISNDEMKKLFL